MDVLFPILRHKRVKILNIRKISAEILTQYLPKRCINYLYINLPGGQEFP